MICKLQELNFLHNVDGDAKSSEQPEHACAIFVLPLVLLPEVQRCYICTHFGPDDAAMMCFMLFASLYVVLYDTLRHVKIVVQLLCVICLLGALCFAVILCCVVVFCCSVLEHWSVGGFLIRV